MHRVTRRGHARQGRRIDVGEAGARLIGDPSGIVEEAASREDPRLRALATEAELDIVTQDGEGFLDVSPSVVGPPAFGLNS